MVISNWKFQGFKEKGRSLTRLANLSVFPKELKSGSDDEYRVEDVKFCIRIVLMVGLACCLLEGRKSVGMICCNNGGQRINLFSRVRMF